MISAARAPHRNSFVRSISANSATWPEPRCCEIDRQHCGHHRHESLIQHAKAAGCSATTLSFKGSVKSLSCRMFPDGAF